jgi:hypothetical protein
MATAPANLLVILGAFAIAYGLYGGYSLELAAAGAGLLLVGVVLFLYEGRWSRAGILPPSSSPPIPKGPAPWWKRPISYHGQYLCTSCGWREEERTTFCPRCGKVLVRLPAPPAANAKS